MSAYQAVGLIAGIASIIGLFLAIYFYIRPNRKVKLLVYEVTKPLPLVKAVSPALSPEDSYSLSVLFQRTGLPEERIKSVYTHFLRFVNLGREPIRKTDIAPANPLKIAVEGVRTLDIGVATVNRPVNKVIISNPTISEHISKADITFDFLDYQDGAVIKILTEGSKCKIELSGDIIGMPRGIKKSQDMGPGVELGSLATIFVLLAFIAASGMCFAAFYWVTGAWHNVWLMTLPFVAWVVPIIIIVLAFWASYRMRPSFPASLELPIWFHLLDRDSYRGARHRTYDSFEDYEPYEKKENK
jgi:hypothetical protein